MIRPRRVRSAGPGSLRLAPAAIAAAGAGLLAVGLVMQLRAPAPVPAGFGEVPGVTTPGTLAASAAPAASAGGDRRSGDDVRAEVRAARPAVRPEAVWLPGQAAPAPVVAVSPTGSGELDPPERVSNVGWWRGGAALGDPAGSVVLVGHVDAADQGLGTFATLREVRPNQVVRLRGRDGRTVEYRITGRRAYSRRHRLPAAVFAQGGPARLVMITCTGAFDTSTAHYADSLVVYAVPR